MMAKLLKPALLVHTVLSAITGALLLVIPGRFLAVLGWAPIDPILSRVLGAALLAMGWGDLRVWRGGAQAETRLWVEVHLGFTALAAIGVLRHLVVARWPLIVWLLFVVFVAFAIIWLLVLLKDRQ